MMKGYENITKARGFSFFLLEEVGRMKESN